MDLDTQLDLDHPRHSPPRGPRRGWTVEGVQLPDVRGRLLDQLPDWQMADLVGFHGDLIDDTHG